MSTAWKLTKKRFKAYKVFCHCCDITSDTLYILNETMCEKFEKILEKYPEKREN